MSELLWYLLGVVMGGASGYTWMRSRHHAEMAVVYSDFAETLARLSEIHKGESPQ